MVGEPLALSRAELSKKVNQILHIAECINTFHGDWGVLWEPGSYSAVTLGDADAVLDKILYILCTRVEAELVSRSSKSRTGYPESQTT